jgi:hypothetical protein
VTRRIALLLGLAFLGLSSLHARATASDAEQTFLQLIADPEVYKGYAGENIDLGPGLFCNRKSTWNAEWNAKLGDADLNLSDNGTVSVHLELAQSWLKIQGYYFSGFLCGWSGGGARIDLSRIATDVDLNPAPGQRFPWVELKNLRFSELKLTNTHVEAPFFRWDSQQLPPSVQSYIERNMNALFAKFMKSEFRVRFDKYLNDSLRQRLSNDAANNIQNPPVP